MDNSTVEKIEQSRRDRTASHSRLLENSSSYGHFLEVEKSAFTPGSLTKRTKELMALSISIVTKCEPCIEWHVEQGRRLHFQNPRITAILGPRNSTVHCCQA